MAYSLVLLIFCALWPASRDEAEWRQLASLLFTSLLSFTGLMLLVSGPMGSLAVVWPAIVSRLEPERIYQRLMLVFLQLMIVLTNLDAPLLTGLTTGLAAASVLQMQHSRLSRWFALGGLALAAGPIAMAQCMSEPPAHLGKDALLLVLPQLGLFYLSQTIPRSRPKIDVL